MLWLINIRETPPGSFFYKQDGRTFGPGSNPDSVASEMSSYRKGNSLPGADYRQCLTDLITYTCARLAGQGLCYDIDQAPIPSPPAGGCGGCGAKV